jgi:hypothetical protein
VRRGYRLRAAPPPSGQEQRARHDRLCSLEHDAGGIRATTITMVCDPPKNWAATDGVRCRPFGSEGFEDPGCREGKTCIPSAQGDNGGFTCTEHA